MTAPTNLRASNLTAQTLSLEWDPAVVGPGGAVRYEVFMDGHSMLAERTTLTSATIRWLVDDTRGNEHQVWVRAVDDSGATADSTRLTVVRVSERPAPSPTPAPLPPPSSSPPPPTTGTRPR